MKSSFSSYLSLFASTGTLFCCALPSLLVSLGMGATLAGLVTNVPQIIWLSQYKGIIFAISGGLIMVAGYLQYRAKFEPCPIDPEQARACEVARVWSLRILFLAAVIWLVGAFFAFLAPIIFQ